MKEELGEPKIDPPQFSATVRIVGSVPVVEVTGELDLATIPQLLDAIGRAGSQLNGLALAAVDLREARFIDAAATRRLLDEAQAMHLLGGELRLVAPREGPVARVFEWLEVDKYAEVHHDLDLQADKHAG